VILIGFFNELHSQLSPLIGSCNELHSQLPSLALLAPLQLPHFPPSNHFEDKEIRTKPNNLVIDAKMKNYNPHKGTRTLSHKMKPVFTYNFTNSKTALPISSLVFK